MKLSKRSRWHAEEGAPLYFVVLGPLKDRNEQPQYVARYVMNKFTDYIQRKAELEAQIARDRALVRDEVLIEIMAAIEEFKFDREDLFPHGKQRKIRPRYFDPESGAVWSGRGREPLWLRGKNRRDFELHDSEWEVKSSNERE
uniref:H-NS histone family protein n=1 Tax=Burkholderia arboris TaxID=488730 RepID=UPI003BEF30BC